jgi:hypothetical protein
MYLNALAPDTEAVGAVDPTVSCFSVGTDEGEKPTLLPEVLVGRPQSIEQNAGVYHMSDHNHFLPHPFHFIIH